MQHIDCPSYVNPVLPGEDILPDECMKCGIYVHAGNCTECAKSESKFSESDLWAFHNNGHAE